MVNSVLVVDLFSLVVVYKILYSCGVRFVSISSRGAPPELWWSVYPLAVTGCASLMVVGESTQLAGGIHLYLW